MKKRITTLLLFIIIPAAFIAQTTQQRVKDFGFTTREITAFTSDINTAFNVVFDSSEIFYVNSANQVCHYKKNSGIWTASGVLNVSAPTVRNGAQLQKAGNKIYYVAATDSKIYQLENIPDTTWSFTLLMPAQTPVRADADLFYSYPHIYYIGADDDVCDLVSAGTSWQGGIALIDNGIFAHANSRIIQPANTALLYYITSTNNICELSWNPFSGWSATMLTSNVKPNTSLETDGSRLYYVSALTNKITMLYWNSGWQATDLPCLENVRTDVLLQYRDSALFFAGATSGKLNILSLNRSGTWASVPVNPASATIKTGASLLAYSNPLFEEGSNSRTFNSINVFYVDNTNKLRYVVYDDLPCTDSYNMLWNTEACKVGGEFPKDWQYGPDANMEKPATVRPDIQIGQNGKDIYFISPDNFIKLMNRVPPDNPIIPDTNKRVLTFSDEFDSLTTTKTKWNPQFPQGNVHQPWNKSQMNGYDNLSYNGGIVNIQTKQESGNYQYWRKNAGWGDDCHEQYYDYSSGSLHTGCLNCNSIVSPVPQLINCSGAPAVKEHTFSQKYGWFEMRTKTPRGKGLWNAFWLLPRDEGYSWANEIDVFEVPGNGKYVAQTNWTDFVEPLHPDNGRYSEAKTIDCIGYRAYADYHTYAVNWTSTAITFYYDNKQTGSFFNYYIPTASEMYMLVNNYVNEGSGSDLMMQSEVSNFPNNWGIDYVRVYLSDSASTQAARQPLQEQYSIFPNPAHKEITIAGPPYLKAEIYNIAGEKILEAGSTTIDLEPLSQGIYFIKITGMNGIPYNFKFIKT